MKHLNYLGEIEKSELRSGFVFVKNFEPNKIARPALARGGL
jgi:hypothetical protein